MAAIALTARPGREFWVSVLLFAIPGAAMVLMEIPYAETTLSSILQISSMVLALASFLFALVAFAWGWSIGSPRWVYPALVLSVLFSLFLSMLSTPPLINNGRLGWMALVPLVVAWMLAILFSRTPWRGVKAFWVNLMSDWITLSLVIFMIILLSIPFRLEEVDHAFSFSAALAGVLILIGGLILFLRSKNTTTGVFVLCAAAFAAIFLVELVSKYYWKSHSVNLMTGVRVALSTSPLLPIVEGSLLQAVSMSAWLLVPLLLGLLRSRPPDKLR